MTAARLTPNEILAALADGTYRVDTTTGDVFNRKGTRITLVMKPSGRRFVRLYLGGRVKSIAVARLVWMTCTRRPVPPYFEIHHRDEDNANDSFGNLLCLHYLDHRKMHAVASCVDDVPF